MRADKSIQHRIYCVTDFPIASSKSSVNDAEQHARNHQLKWNVECKSEPRDSEIMSSSDERFGSLPDECTSQRCPLNSRADISARTWAMEHEPRHACVRTVAGAAALATFVDDAIAPLRGVVGEALACHSGPSFRDDFFRGRHGASPTSTTLTPGWHFFGQLLLRHELRPARRGSTPASDPENRLLNYDHNSIL